MSSNKYLYVVQVSRQLSIDIINRFVKEGKQIHLLTGLVESNYAALDPSVQVTYLNKYDNRTAFKRLFTWGLFTFLSFFYILFRSKKNDLILVSTPPFLSFLGLFFNKIRKQNYHLIIWDLYPDVLVNFGVFKENSRIIKVWKNLNISSFNRSIHVFTLGRHISESIQKYCEKKPIIIPNWVNTDFVKPIEKTNNSFAIHHGLTNKLVVMYSGNLGITHNIDSIVSAAEYLTHEKDIQFVIIGDGARRAGIEAMIKEKNLKNILLLPYQDKSILPFSLSSADIGVVTLGQGAENISVPSKTYYMLAAGSAIMALSSEQSELGLLIADYHCGKVFEKPTPQDLSAFIIQLSKDPELLKQFKLQSRKAALNFTPLNAGLYYQYICNK